MRFAGLIFFILLAFADNFVVFTPNHLSSNTFDVTVLVFGGSSSLEIAIYAAKEEYCWFDGEMTAAQLLSNNCIESTAYATKSLDAQTGWNTLSFDLSDLTTTSNTIYLQVLESFTIVEGERLLEAKEYMQKAQIGTVSQDQGLLMQTDKSLYKPGETMKFRVIPIKRDLYAQSEPEVNVKLTSPDGNIMTQWKQVATGGLVKGEFPIDSQIGETFEGTWVIEATADGYKSAKREIRLEKYILQKFSAQVTAPSFVMAKNSQFQVEVEGLYTYGEGVSGSAKLEYRAAEEWECWGGSYWYFPDFSWSSSCGVELQTTRSCNCDWEGTAPSWWFNSNEKTPSKTTELTEQLEKGKKTFTINTSDFGKSGTICVRGTIIEDGTGLSEQATSDIIIDPVDYKVVFEEETKCVPGFDLETQIKFQDASGMPYNPPAGQPIFSVQKKIVGVNYEQELITIDRDNDILITKVTEGGSTVKLLVKETAFDHTTAELQISVTYGDSANQQTAKLNLNCLYARDETKEDRPYAESRIKVTVDKSTSYFVGDLITFTVDSTKSMQTMPVFYTVSSGPVYGDDPTKIAYTGTMNEDVMSYTATYTATISDVPEIRFTAFAQDGTLLSDYESIKISPKFSNTGVQFLAPIGNVCPEGTQCVNPGSKVPLKLTATQQSKVLIGIVDKSILLMSTPNDITKSYVLDSIMPSDPDYSVCEPYLDTNAILAKSGLTMIASDFANPNSQDSIWYKGGGDIFYMEEVMMVPDMVMEDSAMAPEDPAAVTPSAQATQKRTFFPESWIWEEYDMGEFGTKNINLTAPDTITSWTVTTVSIHTADKMGIANNIDITTYKPFFVSLSLPYEAIRKETFPLNVTIFNYQSSSLSGTFEAELPATLTVENLGSYEAFTQITQTGQTITGNFVVDGSSSITANIMVKAENLDAPGTQSKITVTALPDDKTLIGDQIEQPILISPEGTANVTTYNEVVDGTGTVIPTWNDRKLFWGDGERRVEGSEKIIFSFTGDLMGSTIANLDYLITQPTGCGEQNMLGMAPQVYVYQYLKSVGQLDGKEVDLVTNLETGYQREQKYMHTGGNYGGYSAFGDSDELPSTWLSAFVVSIFTDVYVLQKDPDFKNIVDISKIAAPITWLLKQQNTADGDDQGTFNVVGRVLHDAMMGGVNDKDTVTCYVAAALQKAMDAGAIGETEQNGLDMAMDAVSRILDRYIESSDNGKLDESYLYPFSICAQALILKNPTDTVKVGELLNLLNQNSKTATDLKWWDDKDETDNSLEPNDDIVRCFIENQGVAIEMTSINLLSILETRDAIDGRSIVNWLLKQRNSNGGFSSTQDTIRGLESLSRFASMLSADPPNLTVQIKIPNQEGENNIFEFIINDENKNNYQLKIVGVVDSEFPPTMIQWKVKEESSGQAYLGITTSYHEKPQVDLSTHLDLGVEYYLDAPLGEDCGLLEVKTSWKGAKKSGMTIVMLEALSGCCFVSEALDKLKADNPNIRMIDNSCSSPVLYLNELTKKEEVFAVPLYQTVPVGNTQPRNVRVERYYNRADVQKAAYSKEAALQLPHDEDSKDNGGSSGVLEPEPLKMLLFCAALAFGVGLVCSIMHCKRSTTDEQLTYPLSMDDNPAVNDIYV